MLIEELTERIARLHALLSDPHPGLYSWTMMLASQMDTLTEKWHQPERAKNG